MTMRVAYNSTNSKVLYQKLHVHIWIRQFADILSYYDAIFWEPIPIHIKVRFQIEQLHFIVV